MLDDTARKLLRIMFQFNGHVHRMPSLDELKQLSGHRPAAIKAGMMQLVEQYYIQWDDKQPVETAVVIEAWERDVPFKDQAEAGPHKSQQAPLTGNINTGPITRRQTSWQGNWRVYRKAVGLCSQSTCSS